MADSPSSNPGAAAKQVVTQLRGLWHKLPKLGRIGAIAVLALIVGAIAYTTLASGPPPWVAVSPTPMTSDDVAELSALLASRTIPQRITADGKRVEVPSARLGEARLAASTAGLPRNGTGMEVFDETKLGQSQFTELVNYQRAQQGELERSIKSLGPVESARVHIAVGKRSVFRDADQPPTASVMLTLRAGVTLSPDQVRGVKELVASSVGGLTAARVAVIDQHSNVLSAEVDAGERDGGDAAAREAAIGGRVRSIIEKIVGPGHVAVVVSVEMDRRRVSQSEEIYDPARVAIRSESLTGATTTAPAQSGGIAGVQGNLPGAPAPTGGGGGGAGNNSSASRTYEITRTVRQTDEPEDKVGRIHLAILVDHRADASGHLASLPAADLDQIAQLARQAAGLDEQRGDKLELQSFAFLPEARPTPALPSVVPAALLPVLPVPLPVLAGAAAALLVLVTGVLTVRRRRKHKVAAMPALALPAPLAELERALDAPAGRAALPAPVSVARTLEERVLGSVRNDIPRAARVLAAWLAQPDPRASKS